jgi:hypothetical protein
VTVSPTFHGTGQTRSKRVFAATCTTASAVPSAPETVISREWYDKRSFENFYRLS